MEINLTPAQIHLAGGHTLEYLRQSEADQAIALIAAPRLEDLADRMSLESATRGAEVLVIMQDGRFDVRKTARAAALLREDAEVLVTEKRGGISAHGAITLGPWSHLRASLAAADRLQHPRTITGLPAPGMLLKAMTQADAVPETLTIGLKDSAAVVSATRLKFGCIDCRIRGSSVDWSVYDDAGVDIRRLPLERASHGLAQSAHE